MFSVILFYLQLWLFRLLYYVRGHDKYLVSKSAAFAHLSEPNMKLEAPECGLPGCSLLDHHTYLDLEKGGRLPELRWSMPRSGEAREFVLICEDPDVPIPTMVFVHGLFFEIPPTCFTAYDEDVEGNPHVTGRLTFAGWRYVPNLLGSSYIGASPPYGHGHHRYIFTIVALSEPLDIAYPDKATVSVIKQAMIGKVMGWGEWVGTFQRELPR
ncbi:hypothetical protein AbraIFM66950_000085 [Aspergillus brasiliensis]|nr:hypothetical protein AbraIFM66950_000085 [Aspergillus brasiliensis]